MKVWITKYALTDGIFEADATIDGRYASIERQGYVQFYSAKDWHKTREAAVARAEEMRVEKIASLEKQIEKLKALEF